MQKIYYIAGPYRAPSQREIFENIKRAEAAAIAIWRMGHAVICPHTNSGFSNTGIPEEIFMEGSIAILKRCDGMVLMENWTESAGTIQEIAEASRAGLEILEMKDGRLVTAEKMGITITRENIGSIFHGAVRKLESMTIEENDRALDHLMDMALDNRQKREWPMSATMNDFWEKPPAMMARKPSLKDWFGKAATNIFGV